MSTPTEIMFVARTTSSASSSGSATAIRFRCSGIVGRGLAAGQLDPRVRIERAVARSPRDQLEPVGDVVLDLHPGAAEHAQAVEVADERPVRVSRRRRGLELVARDWSSAAYVRIISVAWLAPGAISPTYRRVPLRLGGGLDREARVAGVEPGRRELAHLAGRTGLASAARRDGSSRSRR